MLNYKDLFEAGVHFGHQKTRWCPKMKPFIWGHKGGIHLIDISKTAVGLERAANFLKSVAADGKPILWVGTKPASQNIIESLATKLNQPYITNRWVGGMLTNFSQVRKSVTKLLHYKDILARADEFPYTKKELNIIGKTIDRLEETIGGIVKLSWPVGALVVVDVKREATAIKEAIQAGVPVVALVDTNCDPTGVDYIIPGNDDSPRSIAIIVKYLASAVEEGKKLAKETKEKAKNVEIEVEEEVVILSEDDSEEDIEDEKESKKAIKAKKTSVLKEEVDDTKTAKKKVVKAKVAAKSSPRTVVETPKPSTIKNSSVIKKTDSKSKTILKKSTTIKKPSK